MPGGIKGGGASGYRFSGRRLFTGALKFIKE